MGKMDEYFAKHSTCNALTHLSTGLGIAWLVSLVAGSGTLGFFLMCGYSHNANLGILVLLITT